MRWQRKPDICNLQWNVHKYIFQNSFWISHVLIASTLATVYCYLSQRPQERSENLCHTEWQESLSFWTGQIHTSHNQPAPCTEIVRAYLHPSPQAYLHFCQEIEQGISPTKLGIRKPPETIWDLTVPSVLQNCFYMRYEGSLWVGAASLTKISEGKAAHNPDAVYSLREKQLSLQCQGQ